MRTHNKRIEVRCSDNVAKLLAMFARKVNETKTEFTEKAIIERCKALKKEEAASKAAISKNGMPPLYLED